MAGYDPQRTGHRPRPENGSSAPVDAILDGPAPDDDAPATDAAPAGDAGATTDDAVPSVELRPEETAAPDPLPSPTERTASAVDLTTVPLPPPGRSPLRLVLAGGFAAAVVALLLWRRSRRVAAGDAED